MDTRTTGAARTYSVLLEGRQHLELTGVEDVLSFDENGILLKTVLGTLAVDGEGLRIVNFTAAGENAGGDAAHRCLPGGLLIEGTITGFCYLDELPRPKRGLLSRRGGTPRRES